MAKDDEKSADGEPTKLKYPISIVFIIGNQFCERFNFYGMRGILTLYLNRMLGYTDDDATFIYHIFLALTYFTPILGAIISDNWLGKYHTVVFFTLVYVCGSITLAVAGVPPLHLPERELVLTALTLIAVGCGCIKPCVVAFGGDQFKLPEQEHLMAMFFGMFYFTINAGSLVSMILTPYFRADIHCFGELQCYPLAFGVPAVLMIVAAVLIIIGRPWYKIVPHTSNKLVEMIRAICHAIGNKRRSNEKREHWLDYADDKYDKQLIADVKAVLRILVLYIPLPIFWSLFDQQGSRWTFQAARMNGEVGSWNILPEQIATANPIMVIILIPLCNYAIYPALSSIGIKRPLQKIVIGGLFTAVAFIISAALEFQLEKTYPILPDSENAQLRIFNGESCNYDVTTNIKGQEKFVLKSLDVYTYKDIDVPDGKFELTYSITSSDPACPAFTTKAISIPEKTAHSIFLNSKNTAHPITDFKDDVDKPKRGLPVGRVLANIKGSSKIHWKDSDGKNHDVDVHKHELKELTKGKHEIFVDGKKVTDCMLDFGGSYTIIINEKADGTYEAKMHIVTEPNTNSIHMLWQVPQYFAITMGEVMYSVTGLEFSYAEAPLSMKSVVQAFWLITVACGNIVVMIVAEVKLMRQPYEFLLFATLMFIDMVVFAFMAYRYKHRDPNAPVH